eukprot:SAG31_NODE_15325_length_760_cov_1.291982_1_plen_210_part_01
MKVVIYGESAGAGGVSNHVAMPESWGLFSGAIMQSGGFQKWVAKPLHEAAANYGAFSKAAGCGTGSNSEVLSCLLDKSAEELLASSEGIQLPSTDSWDRCQWSPVIDGVELHAHPYELLSSGRLAPGVPLILGTNRDEGVSFIGYNRTGTDPDPPTEEMTEDQFNNWAGRIFGRQHVAALRALYPVTNRTGEGASESFYIAAENMVSDYM